MKRLPSTVVALFWLAAAAGVQNGSCLAAASSSVGGQQSAAASTIPAALSHIVRNANECAPDQAKAVWGAGAVLLGYSCYDNPNGM